MSNPESQQRDPLLEGAKAALNRAAHNAREIARQTGTAVVISENGQLKRITFDDQGNEIVTPVDMPAQK